MEAIGFNNMMINAFFLNILYTIIGMVFLFIGIYFGYKILDRITPFNTSKELDDNNIAIGIVVGCMILGICYAIATTVASSLN